MHDIQISLHIFDERTCNVGEGPIAIGVSNEEVWWVDVLEKKILSKDIKTGTTQELMFKEDVSFVIPCSNSDFIIGTASGPIRINRNGKRFEFPTREITQGYPDEFPMRWNDAKVAPDGHLWLGTIAYDVAAHPKDCALYRLDKSGKELIKVIDGVGISNGLAWSSDGKTMFFIDTATLSIDSFKYSNGEVSNRKRMWTTPDKSYGAPDGMCIDSEDGIWVAFWNGGKVRRFNSKFEITNEIDLGQLLVTSCAFAGSKLDLLVITTAQFNQTSSDENLGKTHIARVLIPGRPTKLFGS